MRIAGSHLTYLQKRQDITAAERDILVKFIDHHNAIKPTSTRTKGKQAYEGVWICLALRTCKLPHHRKATLDDCTIEDLMKVSSEASSGAFTKNSRQTKIVALKALAKFLNRTHHRIKNLDLLMVDVKAGSVAKNRKDAISLAEWDQVRALPKLSPKTRAELYMMYDGYHRPGELAILKWSDLKQDPVAGGIQYDITFKTEKTRTIVMRSAAIEVMEAWRKECGALLTDNTPIFPAPDGSHYQTITHLAKLFKKLKGRTGINNLMPSILRNSSPQHDLEAGYPVAYVCLRMWGEPYNELINLYTKPDSGRIQRDQHGKADAAAATNAGLGISREFTTSTDRLKTLEDEMKQMKKKMSLLKFIDEIE
jgi:site-specific recombinase XerD